MARLGLRKWFFGNVEKILNCFFYLDCKTINRALENIYGWLIFGYVHVNIFIIGGGRKNGNAMKWET
jgi:hypothetical protein